MSANPLDVLLGQLAASLNRNVAQSDRAATLARQLEGRVLALALEGTPLTLWFVVNDGRVAIASRHEGAPDARLAGTPFSLLSLAGRGAPDRVRTAGIRIDANAAPPKGVISIDVQHLKLHRLFENVGGLSKSPGEIGGTIKLAGAGDSIAALLGHSDGSLHLLTTGGRVSETLMEEAGLNFANVLIAKMKGDQMIDVDCAAAQFTVAGGVAKTDLFVFDTENAIVVIDGTIDLGDERVDLTLHPDTKNVRIFSLRSPLHVVGNFEHLDVSVDKKLPAIFA